MAPLTESDVVESMRQTPVCDRDGIMSLADAECPGGAALPRLAWRACEVTGGLGRPLSFLLLALHRIGHTIDAGTSDDAIDDALASVKGRVMPVLKVTDSFSLNADNVDMRSPSAVRTVARLLGRMLLLDEPFQSTRTFRVGTNTPEIISLAILFGISFAPVRATAPAAPGTAVVAAPPARAAAAAAAAAAATGSSSLVGGAGVSQERDVRMLKLVAGEWVREAFSRLGSLDDPVVRAMLEGLHAVGGNVVGRVFELLFASALVTKSALAEGDATVSSTLRHLYGTSLADAPLPKLAVATLPKVTKSTRLLDERKKAGIVRTRGSQMVKSLHMADFAWYMAFLFANGCVGIPADATSGSSDLFVRLGVLLWCIALKALSAAHPITWVDVQEEERKAPHGVWKVGGILKIVVTLYATALGDEVMTCLHGVPALILATGDWYFDKVAGALFNFEHASAAARAAGPVLNVGTEWSWSSSIQPTPVAVLLRWSAPST